MLDTSVSGALDDIREYVNTQDDILDEKINALDSSLTLLKEYVDSENDKYLTVDDMGNLFLLAFKNYKLILQFLGEINYSSCITYLDNNYLFNGSSKANSQLIKVLTVPKEERTKPFIDIIEEYESLAPISDFAVVNNSKEENSIEILSVSGTDKNCSIKNIRKGTSLIFNGEIPLSGVKSVFLIKYIKNKNTMIIDDGNDDNKIKANATPLAPNI